MTHICADNLFATSDTYEAQSNGLKYRIYMCAKCRKYYVNRLGKLVELGYDYENKTYNVKKFAYI